MKKNIFEKVDEIRNSANESYEGHKFVGTFLSIVLLILYVIYSGGFYLPIFSELLKFFVDFAVQLHILKPMLIVLIVYIIYCFNIAKQSKAQYEYFK
jgi:hypothetical protein